MVMAKWRRWAVLSAVVGCHPTPAKAPAQPGDSSAAARPAPSSTATTGEDANRIYGTAACRDLADRYDDRLAAAAGTCVADADCGRFGGVQPDDVCGGVTDAATATALTSIRAEMDDAGCMALPYSCPALEARCVAGMCR